MSQKSTLAEQAISHESMELSSVAAAAAPEASERQEWNRLNIDHLLELEQSAPGCWRALRGDSNLNGRSFGGQLLGQALVAGTRGVPVGRHPTMMQLLFLQGAMPSQPLDFHVTTLQEGKRFSSRHVRATQGGSRIILDAQVTCALAIEAPEHEVASRVPAGERPEDLVPLEELDPALLQNLSQLGGYTDDRKPSIDFRIPDPHVQLAPESMNGRFRFWIRPTQVLPDDPFVHAGAFAYLSDWWVNFCALGLHQREVGKRRLYISSLNHGLWLHRPFRTDQWLHVEVESPVGVRGRGHCIGRVHDRKGRALASVSQECLMGYAD